jgi:hypothetical protein
MDGAEIIVLPVIRIERDDQGATADPKDFPVDVVDINVFRVRRARAMVERRASRSLLPELGHPAEMLVCGPDGIVSTMDAP